MFEMDKLLQTIATMKNALQQQKTQQPNISRINVMANFEHFNPETELFEKKTVTS